MKSRPTMRHVNRRKMLFGSAALVASAALPRVALATAPATSAATADAKFLSVSKLLINHRLDPDVGKRIARFAQAQYPDLDALLDQITTTAGTATEVEAFFGALPEGHVRDFAHWVISAWYTGSSSPAANATLFTYEEALMYQPTRDMVGIPSFGFAAPDQWGRDLYPLANLPQF